MKNRDIAEQFLNHRASSNRSASLSTDGTRLFSYFTCIAQFYNDPILGKNILIGNNTKYSTTSSRYLNYVRKYIDVYTSKNVPTGTKDLVNYI